MAPIDLSETPPSSPTHSPPRKKAKFSLRLKVKSKGKKDDDGNDNKKSTNLYPLFRSPIQESDGVSGKDCMDVDPILPSFPLAGLLNRGNICYANAVVQVLRRCPGFERFVTDLARDIKVLEDSDYNDKDINIEPKYVITYLSKLLSQMFDYEVDFLSDQQSCIHLRNKGPNLVLAAEPNDFMAAFRELYTSFECNLQHDAQEFLCSLIMALQESANKIYNNNSLPLPASTNSTKPSQDPLTCCHKPSQESLNINSKPCEECTSSNISNYKTSFQDVSTSQDSFIKKLFQGKLVHQTKCLNCEQSKLRYEDIQEVSVPVVEDQPYLDARKKLMLSPTPKKNKVDVHTLEWAISQFASSECLQGNNKYFCENCNTYCEARISTCFEELPTVLTVHLKRFTSSIGLSSKITSNLQTPLTLSVQEWCSQKCQTQNNTYELFGIVLHSGISSGSGHYETYIRIPKQEQKEEMVADSITPCVMGDNVVGDVSRDKMVVKNATQGKNEDRVENMDVNSDRVVGDNVARTGNSDSGHVSNTFTSDIEGDKVVATKEASVIDSDGVDNKKVTSNTNGDRANNAAHALNKKNIIDNSNLNVNPSTNGDVKDGCNVDINQNSIDKQDENLDSDDSQRATKRKLRPRKTRKSARELPEEDSSGKPEEEEGRKQEGTGGTEDDKSPLNAKGKSSCISLITKYFQRSKKPPTNSLKTEKLQRKGTEKSEVENEENCSSTDDNSEIKKPSTKKVRTIEDSFKRNNANTPSKSSTIRKLNFVKGAVEETERAESDSQESEDNVQPTITKNLYPDELTRDWVHFDDCAVDGISKKDIIDVLSASESSYMSPYLLFYQKSQSLHTL